MDTLDSPLPPAPQPPDPTAPLSPMLAPHGETPDQTAPAGSPSALAALAAAMDFAAAALAPATLRAYRADWNHFLTWCREAGWAALPASPHTVAAYLAAMATTHTTSVLERRLATLSRAHRLAGLDWPRAHPAIRNTLRGILRHHGRPARQAAALATDELIRLVETCETTPVGRRDRALLLIGYAGALRRSELVAITQEDVVFTTDGLRLTIPRAKGDQTGKGASLGIPRGNRPDTCPVRALELWLEVSNCRFGPVFRAIDRLGVIATQALHADSVRLILSRRAAIAGLTAPAARAARRFHHPGLYRGCA
jgi:integrase